MKRPDSFHLGTSPTKRETRREGEIQRLLSILHKWGIHTIGQLAALDKEELAARLGPQTARMWERANGKSQRLLKLVQPPESFEESFEFEQEIETAEPLLFMLRRFLEQLALRLSAIYLVAKELTLRINFSYCREDGHKETYERVFKIPQPTNDVDLLFRILHTHLENFTSEHPIVAVALTAKPIRPVSQQFGLFETALKNPHQLYETLARLTALLGAEQVGTPVLEETHRPDAFRMEPFSWNFHINEFTYHRADAPAPLTEGEGRVRASGFGFARVALRRFRPAAPASIFSFQDRPDSRAKDSHFTEVAGSPTSYLGDYEQSVIDFEGSDWGKVRRHLQSEKIGGQIVDQRGPYLLSGNWWDEKSWGRAEWDVELKDEVVCRSYQNVEGDWMIDGIYD